MKNKKMELITPEESIKYILDGFLFELNKNKE